MSDDSITFSFMRKTSKKVRKELLNDPKCCEWMSEVNQYFEDNQEYQDLSTDLIQYLSEIKGPDLTDLITSVENIFNYGSDNIDYFYDQIFQISEEEEEEEECPTSDTIDIDITDKPTKTIDEKSLDPKSYFQYHIDKVATELFISKDLSYIILNNYKWDYDRIKQIWWEKEKEKSELLKKLRVDRLDDLKRPLKMEPTKKGECSICCDTENLYKLYCGHVICESCLKSEVLVQINDYSLPLCRYEIENNVICNAEILPDDVHQLLDEKQNKTYDIMFLNKEISTNKNVKACQNPYCDWIITTANILPCNAGRCYHCNAVTCLLGDHDSHAPLRKCELANYFIKEIHEEMKQLEQDQNNWMAREHRLLEYRHTHRKEVKDVFDQTIQQLIYEQKKERENEKEKIRKLEDDKREIQANINEYRNKLNAAIDKHKPQKEIQTLINQIEYLTKDIKELDNRITLFNDTNRVKEQERCSNLKIAQDEAMFFLGAIEDLSLYQYNMNKFKESQDVRAFENVEVTNNDEDYVNKITRKCPKCGAPLLRNEGCNHMKCPICKFDFCWICDQEWYPTHGMKYFECPNLKLYTKGSGNSKSGCGIDFNDMNDTKFYPQPMTIEKRTKFILYNNLYKKYQEEKEVYKKLKDDLMSIENKVDISNGLSDVEYYNLCKRKRIEKCLLEGKMMKMEAELNTMRIINTALFAQSVVMWSYPTMYFMSHDRQRMSLLEFRVKNFIKIKDQLLQYISNPTNLTFANFSATQSIIEEEIKNIIDDAVFI